MTALTHREQVALAGAGVMLLLLFVRAFRRRRQLARRLSSIAARLVGPADITVDGKGGLERTLARLEQAAQDGALRVSDADEGRHRMSFVLDQVAEGIVMWDEHGNEVLRNEPAVAMLSEAATEALASELVGRVLAEATAGRSSSQSLDLFGPPRRTLAVSAFPLDDGRRSLGAAAVIDDVSERRRLEAVRRDFLANVGDRLVQPVTALAALCGQLEAPSDGAGSRRLVARVREEADRLRVSIDDLAELSRIEAQGTPVREPVPVHLVLAEAAGGCNEAARAFKVTVEVDEPDHRLTVLGDRRQLVGAVTQLLANAVAASPAGSTVEVLVATEGDWIDVVVTDRGVGIPLREIDRIFERFYRIKRSTPDRPDGPGLGLALVRHVAGNHGGAVTVESEEGGGSTFRLRLPSGPAGRAILSSKAG